MKDFMKSKIITSIVVILLASLACKTFSNVNIPLSTATMAVMSPTNTANAIEQVWAQLIIVDTEDEAIQVLDRLGRGGDWNKIAAEVSTDINTSKNGGDLG
jgi:parvulin-like peptidyl-prolyl isomerase